MAVTVGFVGTRVAVATIATDTGTWGNDGGGGGVADEPDFVYQGTTAQSRKISTSRNGRNYTHGSGTDMAAPANRLFYLKMAIANPNILLARTAPAAGIKIGSSSSNYVEHYIFGAENFPAKSGFQFVPIAPEVTQYWGTTSATPPLFRSTLYWSILADFSGGSKAENVVIDAIDCGAGLHLSGNTPDGVFQDFIDTDPDTTTNRWGVVTEEGGVLLVNGGLFIGTNSSLASTLTDFTDATGAVLIFRNGYLETGSAQLVLDAGNASTDISITNMLCISDGELNNTLDGLYQTLEDTRAQLICQNTDGNITLTSCSLVNFRRVELNSATTVNLGNFQVDQLVQGSADLENATIRTLARSTDSTLKDPTFGTTTDLNNCEFIQEGAGHAIELGQAAGATSTNVQSTPASHGNIGGTTANPATGTSVAWNTHAVDDIGVMWILSDSGDPVEILTAAADWNLLGITENSGNGVDGVRMAIYWRRATSAAEPAVDLTATPGDHWAAQIITVTGCPNDRNPIADFAMKVGGTTSTAHDFPAVTSKSGNEHYLGFVAKGNEDGSIITPYSSATNSNLSSITLSTGGTNAGNGHREGWIRASANARGDLGATTITSDTTDDWVSAAILFEGTDDDVDGNRGEFQAAQTLQSGVGAVSVAWPTHVADDVAFLIAETEFNETPTLSTPAGFTLLDSVATTTGTGQTRCTIWWKRATTAAEATPTIADPGDHINATMITFRGCRTTGNPWDDYATSINDTAGTSHTIGESTSLFAGQRIFSVITRGNDAAGADFSSFTQAGHTSITERFDDGSTDGTGGGIAAATSVDTVEGATGDMTVTSGASTKSACFTIVLAAVEDTWNFEELTFTDFGDDERGGPSNYASYNSHTITTETSFVIPFVVNMPTHNEGDLLIASLHSNAAASATWDTTPEGWTEIPRTTTIGDHPNNLYYKIAGPSEPATYTWDLSLSARQRAVVASYSNVSQGDPIWGIYGPALGTGGDVDVSIKGDEENLLNVRLGAQVAASMTWSSTGGTERVDSWDSTLTLGFGLYDEEVTATNPLSPDDTFTVTSSDASDVVGWSLNLRSAASAIAIPSNSGQHVINVSGGSTPSVWSAGAGWRIVSAVTVTVNVEDPDGNAIEGARVRLEAESDGSLVADGETNALGVFTASVAYSVDIPVRVKVRLIGWDPFEAGNDVTNTGLTATAILQPDSIVNLPGQS